MDVFNKSYLPLIILASVLLFLSSCKDIQSQRLIGRRSLKKALFWAQQDSIRVSDSLKSAAVIEGAIDDAVQDSSGISEDVLPTEEGTKNQYYIIVGTYANSDNANAVASQFRAKGYQTSILRSNNNLGDLLNMVSIESFANYEEALNYLNQIRSKVDSTVWLYRRK